MNSTTREATIVTIEHMVASFGFLGHVSNNGPKYKSVEFRMLTRNEKLRSNATLSTLSALSKWTNGDRSRNVQEHIKKTEKHERA